MWGLNGGPYKSYVSILALEPVKMTLFGKGPLQTCLVRISR